MTDDYENDEFTPAEDYQRVVACERHAPWVELGWIAKGCAECVVTDEQLELPIDVPAGDRHAPRQDLRGVEL